MEIINGKICISFEELTGRIITTANLQALVRKKQVRRVQKGGNGRVALYEVESLPLKWRTEVYKRYPDAKEQAESRVFMDTVEPDGAAFDFFQSYTLSDGRHLPDDKVLEYSANAAIMNAFRRCWEAHVSKRQRTGKKAVAAKEFWARAAAALPRLADRFPHSLPGSARRLQMKMAEYVRDGYVCFISGKFLNGNAAKVSDREKEAVLVNLLNNHNNLDFETIAGYYNAEARLHGWKEITAGAVQTWYDKKELYIKSGRLGETRFRNTLTMQVKRSRPTAAYHMWTLDGWVVEWLYQDVKTNSQGHKVTTYCNRLTLEVVLDPCCDYPIGYAIGTHETPDLIREALHDAMRHTRELFGVMLRPNQLQCDNYKISTMMPIYASIAMNVTPARRKNAKSKVVEPYFNYLNKTYCKRFNNWSGYGITSDPDSQPSADWLNRHRHEIPTKDVLISRIIEMINIERLMKRAKFEQFRNNLAPERQIIMDKERYLLTFGLETGFTNKLEGSGIRPTLLGVKRAYDCFDIRFRERPRENWRLKYDPDDLSQILAVSEDGTRRFLLEEKYVQPMALADRKDGDYLQLEKVRRFNEDLETHITNENGRYYDILDEHMGNRENILSRLCLTDSKGQHKLPAAKLRLAAADIEALEVETVEVPMMQAGDDCEFDYNNF
ncbi:hypothetical protein [uncultured Duncaniella sp.]|uniref:hypothetical protein n=1 Tax=uncultured Duncaniella sp. TaxID=2768039 RepID=UPI0026F3E6D3|nr:hypothetical protein [uncultured Duncaniella sp.]